MGPRFSSSNDLHSTPPDLLCKDSERGIVGEFAMFLYLVIWISSLLSPFIVIWLIYNNYYILSTVIIIPILISYLPSSMDDLLFNKSFRRFMFWAFSKYYKQCSMRWTKGSIPHSQSDIDLPHSDAIPSLLWVHP